MITIAHDGSGDFKTVMEALDSIKNSDTPETIYIKKGIYKEIVEIRRSNLTIEGEGCSDTVLTYNNCANMDMEDGSKRGTFRSYSFLIIGDNVTVKNITIENSAGSGLVAGQAIAAYVEGDMITFSNCALKGYQDTLFTGPLPEKVVKPNGFVGPTEFAKRINGRQLYDNCYIEGDVDFIFGSATAFFRNCEICSLNRDMECNGFAAAPSTPEGQAYGYVFEKCRFTNKDCADGTVFLGRPWREYAQIALIDCEIGKHISPLGFDDWNKQKAREVCRFSECRCFGPGADTSHRDDYVIQMTDEEAKNYTLEKVFEKR